MLLKHGGICGLLKELGLAATTVMRHTAEWIP